MSPIVVVTLLLALPIACTRPSSDAETTALVREALAKQGCTVRAQEGRTLRTICGDAALEGSMNLENLDEALKATSGREARARAVSKFVEALTAAQREPTADALPAASLRPSLKSKAAIEATLARVPPEKRVQNRLPTWPVAGAVVAVVVVDRPDTMTMVMQHALDSWKTTEADVWAKALANLDAHPLAPKRIVRDGATLAVLDDPDDAYEAARLLSAKSRGSLEQMVGGHAVFVAPDREHLAAAKAADPSAVGALRALAKELASGAYGISADVYEADDAGQFRVVP